MSLRDGPFPNGGWRYYQPQTKWSTPMPLAMTFQATVDSIIQHRLKNQAVTRKHRLATDWNTVANELEEFTRRRLNLPEDSPDPKQMPAASLQGPPDAAGDVDGFLANTGRRLKAAVTGIKVYIDTFGETARPVEQVESERRAAICAVCPKNEKGDWKTFFTEEAAKGIMGIFAILKDLDLRTAQDPNLGICSACLCPLKQKVHVKLEHILKHTNAETIARLKEAPACWIVK